MVGDLKDFGTVWYNPASLANILSAAQVRKVCRITMDTKIEPEIMVHRKNGTEMEFFEYRTGLYYYEVPMKKDDKLNDNTNTYCFVTTVANNKIMFTRREIQDSDKAKELHAKISRLEQQIFDKN